MICSTIVNSKRTDNKQKIYSPSDFMPKFEQSSGVKTPKSNSLSKEEFLHKAKLFQMMMS